MLPCVQHCHCVRYILLGFSLPLAISLRFEAIAARLNEEPADTEAMDALARFMEEAAQASKLPWRPCGPTAAVRLCSFSIAFLGARQPAGLFHPSSQRFSARLEPQTIWAHTRPCRSCSPLRAAS